MMLSQIFNLSHVIHEPHFHLIITKRRVHCRHPLAQFINALHRCHHRFLAIVVDPSLPQVLQVILRTLHFYLSRFDPA